jgi:hypothetical protein
VGLIRVHPLYTHGCRLAGYLTSWCACLWLLLLPPFTTYTWLTFLTEMPAAQACAQAFDYSDLLNIKL